MKNLLLLLVVGIFMFHSFSCSAGNHPDDKSAVAGVAGVSTQSQVISLDEAAFVEKVFDFKNNKEWAYKGDRPAIIDFYAEWCGPCKRLAPVLVELQKEYGDKIQIYKVDAEKNRELAASFGVNSYPTLLFIPMTEKPGGARGALPKEELERIISTFLKVTK